MPACIYLYINQSSVVRYLAIAEAAELTNAMACVSATSGFQESQSIEGIRSMNRP